MESTYSNDSPYEQRQPKYEHDNGLCHEQKSQLRHLQREKWQLEDDEDEEAEHLGRGDVRASWNMIWETFK